MSQPSMARLYYSPKDLPEGQVRSSKPYCTGTLIDKRFVLTSAACLYNRELLSVRLGEFDESTDPDCRNVRGRFTCTSVLNVAPEQVFVHESFSPRSFSYDIALIKLARDVEFSESISPICLPVTEELQKAEMDVYTLIGWGTNPVVTEATVSYINNTECAKSYPELTSHQMCTSTPNDLCRGTAGSPLSNVNVFNDLQRRVQFGIVSYGKASCEDGVYTEVSSFIPWIALKVGTHAG